MPRQPTAIHVVPAVDGWAVTREGRDPALSHHRSEEEAVQAGREVARREGAPFVAHDASGQVPTRALRGWAVRRMMPAVTSAPR
jgi:hypothetical protein